MGGPLRVTMPFICISASRSRNLSLIEARMEHFRHATRHAEWHRRTSDFLFPSRLPFDRAFAGAEEIRFACQGKMANPAERGVYAVKHGQDMSVRLTNPMTGDRAEPTPERLTDDTCERRLVAGNGLLKVERRASRLAPSPVPFVGAASLTSSARWEHRGGEAIHPICIDLSRPVRVRNISSQ
jgi:hypothetical protein